MFHKYRICKSVTWGLRWGEDLQTRQYFRVVSDQSDLGLLVKQSSPKWEIAAKDAPEPLYKVWRH